MIVFDTGVVYLVEYQGYHWITIGVDDSGRGMDQAYRIEGGVWKTFNGHSNVAYDYNDDGQNYNMVKQWPSRDEMMLDMFVELL